MAIPITVFPSECCYLLRYKCQAYSFSITRNYALRFHAKFRQREHRRSKIGCSVIDTKGLVIRSRRPPDFHQTEIKVVLDLQSANTNLSNPRCYFACGWTRHAAIQFRERAMRSDKSNIPERLVSDRVFRITV
jgi:hypothetical protein